jgi:hypothetical protein
MPPTPTSYPTAEDFASMLQTGRLPEIVHQHILTGLPYAFRNSPADFDTLRNHLSGRLRVAQAAIRIVGSARTGFSLDPYGFPRPFGRASDLDVIVVSQELFDHIWFTLLDWNYPRRYRLVQPDRRWSHQRQDDLYWGWFDLSRLRDVDLSFRGALKPIRDLSAIWFDAFQSVSQYPSLASWTVKGRLYRGWEHVLLYHVDGLAKLRDRVVQEA